MIYSRVPYLHMKNIILFAHIAFVPYFIMHFFLIHAKIKSLLYYIVQNMLKPIWYCFMFICYIIKIFLYIFVSTLFLFSISYLLQRVSAAKYKCFQLIFFVCGLCGRIHLLSLLIVHIVLAVRLNMTSKNIYFMLEWVTFQ